MCLLFWSSHERYIDELLCLIRLYLLLGCWHPAPRLLLLLHYFSYTFISIVGCQSETSKQRSLCCLRQLSKLNTAKIDVLVSALVSKNYPNLLHVALRVFCQILPIYNHVFSDYHSLSGSMIELCCVSIQIFGILWVSFGIRLKLWLPWLVCLSPLPSKRSMLWCDGYCCPPDPNIEKSYT